MTSINLGHVELVTVSAGQASANSAHGPSGVRPAAVTLAEAQRLGQRRILQPSWLPSPTMKLERVLQQALSLSGSPRRTSLLYRDGSGQWVSITQYPHEVTGGKLLTPLDISPVTVAGQTAAIAAFRITAKNEPDGGLAILIGFWEHEDLLIELQGSKLTVQVLARIGESLQ